MAAMTENMQKWVNNSLAKLKVVDSLLRCGICYEYLSTTMMTPCSHNYCSYCIRRSMTYKSQCPTCFLETAEPQLQNNRVLDDIVSKFTEFSSTLLEKLKDVTPTKQVQSEDFSTTSDEFASPTQKRQGFTSDYFYGNNEKSSLPNSPPANATSRTDPITAPSPLSTWSAVESSNLLPIAVTTSNKSKDDVDGKVPCPVCSIEILFKHINHHVNQCLLRAEKKDSLKSFGTSGSKKRPPLPKVMYKLMKDKELKNKLKDHGLSTKGDRQVLIKRHQNFTILYNSECDSLNPKPAAEIARMVERQEKNEKSGGHSSKNGLVLPFNKKTDPATIEAEQGKYRKTNKSQYDELLADVTRRRGFKPPAAKDSSSQPSTSSSSASPNLSQTLVRNCSLPHAPAFHQSSEATAVPHVIHSRTPAPHHQLTAKQRKLDVSSVRKSQVGSGRSEATKRRPFIDNSSSDEDFFVDNKSVLKARVQPTAKRKRGGRNESSPLSAVQRRISPRGAFRSKTTEDDFNCSSDSEGSVSILL